MNNEIEQTIQQAMQKLAGLRIDAADAGRVVAVFNALNYALVLLKEAQVEQKQGKAKK